MIRSNDQIDIILTFSLGRYFDFIQFLNQIALQTYSISTSSYFDFIMLFYYPFYCFLHSGDNKPINSYVSFINH